MIYCSLFIPTVVEMIVLLISFNTKTEKLRIYVNMALFYEIG